MYAKPDTSKGYNTAADSTLVTDKGEKKKAKGDEAGKKKKRDADTEEEPPSKKTKTAEEGTEKASKKEKKEKKEAKEEGKKAKLDESGAEKVHDATLHMRLMSSAHACDVDQYN